MYVHPRVYVQFECACEGVCVCPCVFNGSSQSVLILKSYILYLILRPRVLNPQKETLLKGAERALK